MLTVDMDVRYRDIDTMGHVNNAVYVSYLEQARNVYFRDVVGEPLTAVDTVIVNLEVEFARAIDPTDDVVVEVTLGELGESSMPMEYVVRANGEVAATASTTMVHVSADASESRPLPAEWREALEAEKASS